MFNDFFELIEPFYSIVGKSALFLLGAGSVTLLFIWLVKTFWKVFLAIGAAVTIIFFIMMLIPAL